MTETKSHTLKLRIDEFTEVTITYHDTALDWMEFSDDAAEFISEYVYDQSHFVSVTTTEKH